MKNVLLDIKDEELEIPEKIEVTPAPEEAPKKAPAKKTTAKKTPAKKAPAKKTAKKAPARKTTKKK